MRLSDFDYVLPPEAVAQHPAPSRSESRLMALDRHSGDVSHHVFNDLPGLLRAGDLVVVNDTKVRAARLYCRKPTGGRVEVLLVEPDGDDWLALAQANKPLKPGVELTVEGCEARLTIVDRPADGMVRVHLDGDVEAIAEEFGQLPLPPYMGRPAGPQDAERYQTIFARADRLGSVAAPTAGLHFTPELVRALEDKGVRTTEVTLHVGPGTFLPVRTDDLAEHSMHAERFQLPPAAATAIAETRRSGGRVVAVGTTVTRVLETVADASRPGSGSTDLFIRPGFSFRHVDALITNFHLPRSTLLMLVCAYAGRERVLRAYSHAVEAGYRFYSYGDAMLIQ